MLSSDQSAGDVWQMLEQIYLEAANSRANSDYANMSETDKRAILMEFARRQAITSKRWVEILRNLRLAELFV
jgi:restriction endonuclease